MPTVLVSRPTLATLLRQPDGLDATTSSLLTRHALGCSRVAWDTLLRDGDLVAVREGFALVAGTSETPEHRASSLVAAVPSSVVVARSWAAWVHTGGPPPPEAPRRVCVVYRRGASRPRNVPGLEPVQAALRPWDVDSLAGLRLTSALRTTMDVATWESQPEAARTLHRLLTSCVGARDVLVQLDRVVGWRGADQARDRIMRTAAALPDQGRPEPG